LNCSAANLKLVWPICPTDGDQHLPIVGELGRSVIVLPEIVETENRKHFKLETLN
jgi:hypothetical protein